MRRVRFWALPAIGVLLVAVGLLPFTQPRSYGWFAYTPASGQVFVPGSAPLPGPGGLTPWVQALGLGAVVIGLLLIAGWVSYLWGRRRP